jgi:hypothetical protein
MLMRQPRAYESGVLGQTAMKPMPPPISAAMYGRMYGARRSQAAAQAQAAYQNKLGGCRTQCAPRPVLWQQHCQDLCMQGKVMPCIANETWPPCVAARSVKGIGELPAPLGVPLWGWALGLAGVGALVFMMRR